MARSLGGRTGCGFDNNGSRAGGCAAGVIRRHIVDGIRCGGANCEGEYQIKSQREQILQVPG